MVTTLTLPYLEAPWAAMAALRPLGRPVLLHSAAARHPWARHDVLAAGPIAWVESRDGETFVGSGDGPGRRSARAPFALLDELLAELPPEALPPGVPFAGGLLGLLGYDLVRQLEPLGERTPADHGFPDLAVGLYGWAVVTDHESRTTRLVARAGATRQLARIAERLRRLGPGPPAARCRPHLRPETDRGAYRARFARIHDYLHAGDCYQVNLAVRFSGAWRGDPLALQRALSREQPAPFAGYLEVPAGAVLSLSPERFLRVEDGAVETSPIKGTRPRGETPERDAALRAELETSEKERAENLMIVDLLRNDLGRSCVPGSIAVPELFRVQSFRSVHHLVSTVRGRLAPEVTPLTALARAFPGGSVTGAPKLRAMEIIDELEPARRGPYCGSLLLADAGGRLDSSITIRTLLHARGRLHCWGGGGIVADSRADAEWAEIRHKVGALVAGTNGSSSRSERARSASASSA